jgi:uncharacterized coiled-coil protein SlyX
MRRLFGPSQVPDTSASTLTATVASAPPEGLTPRTPTAKDPSDSDNDDRRRLSDLEAEVTKYKGLFEDINHYVVAQQAAHDAALAASQAQINQLLSLANSAAASSGQSTAASISQPAAASSGQSAAARDSHTADAPAAAAEDDPCRSPRGSQQGDSPEKYKGRSGGLEHNAVGCMEGLVQR